MVWYPLHSRLEEETLQTETFPLPTVNQLFHHL